MIIAKIVGSAIATRKNEKLVGSKFLIVEPLANMSKEKTRFVAIDTVGAGIGDLVLITQGSGARIGTHVEHSPIDAAIVGIIDDGLGLE